MLEYLGFKQSERRLAQWIFALAILAMIIYLTILDYVAKYPSWVQSLSVVEVPHERPQSLSEVLHRIRPPE